jgi:hypothetical protein
MALTEAELKVIELTADLWNAYVALAVSDRLPSEREEMARDIHSIQQRIMARSARRAHPDIFR